jgi:hypothetical protein
VQDAWHVIQWIWVAVLCTYLVVQVFALWRLKGDQKRRSNTVLTVMLILMFGSDAIRDVFFVENRVAGQVGKLVTGVAAIVATVVLTRMFGESPVVTADSKEDGPEVQSLNLS